MKRIRTRTKSLGDWIALTAAVAALWPASAYSGPDIALDSVPILGYYSRRGKALSRRTVERLVSTTEAAAPYVRKSKGNRVAGNLLSLSLFGVSCGLTAKSAMGEINLPQLWVPVAMGQLGSIVSGHFTSRANHLLRHGVVEFNNRLRKERGLENQYDQTVIKSQSHRNFYEQDGVGMSKRMLYYFLLDAPPSKPGAMGSLICREIGSAGISVGLFLLSIAIVHRYQHMDADGYLKGGIALMSLGLTFSIGSEIGLNLSMRDYNAAVSAGSASQ